MSDSSETFADAFEEETDADTAATAAENVAAFAEQYDEEGLTADAVLETFAEAPYDGFERRFNWLVGELAAASDDCTDSREFRLDGFGDLAADPEIGA